MRVPKSKLDFLMTEYGTDSITETFNRLIDEKLEHRFQANTTRSVISALGAKNRVARRMIALMPKHDIYIEPFGNTASVLLQKPQVKKEVYNDINGNVVNFFRVLRDNPLGLYNKCSSLPYSEEVYQDFVKSDVPDDPLEKAVRFFYLSRCGFLGVNSKSFKSHSSKRNDSAFYYRECERFYAVSRRFQGVEITNKDFATIIRRYKDHPNAFIMADPPYFDGTDYYHANFKLADHSKLARMLANISGKAMVCHSKNYQIHKLYTGLGFNFEVIRTKYLARASVQDKGKLVKPNTLLYLYMNY